MVVEQKTTASTRALSQNAIRLNEANSRVCFVIDFEIAIVCVAVWIVWLRIWGRNIVRRNLRGMTI